MTDHSLNQNAPEWENQAFSSKRLFSFMYHHQNAGIFAVETQTYVRP